MTSLDVPEDAIDDSRDAAGSALIPFVELDPKRMSAEERFDAFFDMSMGLYDFSIDVPTLRRQGILSRSWLLHDLIFFDAEMGTCTSRRTARHIAKATEPHVLLQIARGQKSYLTVGDSVICLNGHAMYLTDLSRPHAEICGPINYKSVYLPHDAIGYDPGRHPAHLNLSLDSPYGHVLAAAFESLHGQLDNLRQADAAALAATFSSIVNGCYRLTSDRGQEPAAFRAARRKSIRDFIDVRLRDPDLGLATVMQGFGVGRTTLYRDFAEEGGLEHYIYERRLARAYSDLVNGPPERGRVQAVAQSWGFSSSSHFCRRFLDRFGCRPGEVVGLGWLERDDQATADRPTLHDNFYGIIGWIWGKPVDGLSAPSRSGPV